MFRLIRRVLNNPAWVMMILGLLGAILIAVGIGLVIAI